LNLFWLRYVSYALLAGAAFFYFAIRLNKLSLTRTVKLDLYAACLLLAMGAWRFAEYNADQHSPRHLAVGTVATIAENIHRGGSIDDVFQLQTSAGSLSPKFSTGILAGNGDQQPIHHGDLVGVLYRTWDNVPVTIDEIEGQHAGWHYHRTDHGSAFVFGVFIAGTFGFLSAVFATRNQRPRTPVPSATLNLND
jgi:hypothetical protein